MRALTLIVVFLLTLAGCVTTGGRPPISKAKMSDGYYMKGLSYLQEKDYEMASVEFNRSLQIDSDNKEAYYGLGIISDLQGMLDDAQKYFEKAIDRDSKYSEAYNALGVVFAKQRKWDKAEECFRKALENKLYTTPHIPYLNLGDLYMAQKEYGKAAEAYRQSQRFVNLDITILKLGTALFDGGKIQEAISEFRKGVDVSPQNVNMRYSLALAYAKAGDRKSAVSEFQTVVRLAPRSEIALKANDYIKTLR
jgi:type IV pilus assembly protein PilF